MFRLSPTLLLYFLILSLLALILLFLVSIAGLIQLPDSFFQWYLSLLMLVLFWWPFDMLLHWEKRTAASIRKDKVILAVALTVILFVASYHWLGFSFWLCVGVAVGVGSMIPSLFWCLRSVKSKRVVIQPGTVYQIGIKSPRAQEFLKYFPDARQYVYGITERDGEYAHFALHQRRACETLPGYWIDYVMDITVDRRLGISVGSMDKLHCYLFRNDGDRAGIGFLPSTNIGRALDYGFSDDEMEKAITDATTLDHRWPALGLDPLIVQHYVGHAMRMR